MQGTDTTGGGAGRYRRVRRADALVAVVVGTGDVLLCGALFVMVLAASFSIGGPDAAQQAEMEATNRLAGRLYVGWLAGGLLLFGLFGLFRSALTHVVCMVAPPAAFLAYLAAAG